MFRDLERILSESPAAGQRTGVGVMWYDQNLSVSTNEVVTTKHIVDGREGMKRCARFLLILTILAGAGDAWTQIDENAVGIFPVPNPHADYCFCPSRPPSRSTS